MAITPADIEKKTFSTALRGYDLDEVDDFLDEMVVAVRELEEELTRARARVAELEQSPGAPAPDAAVAEPSAEPSVVPSAPAPDESAVGRALVAAQQAADRMLEDARSEADKIVGDARSEADTFANERDLKKAEVESEMAEMTGLVAGVRNQLAVLATTVADKLDEMDAVVATAHTSVSEGDGVGDDMSTADMDAEAEAIDEGGDFGGVEPEDEFEDDDLGIDDSEDAEDADLEVDSDESDDGEGEVGAGSSEIEGVEDREERHEF